MYKGLRLRGWQSKNAPKEIPGGNWQIQTQDSGFPEEYGGRIGHSLQKTRKIYRQTELVSQLDAGKVKGEAGGEGVQQGHKGEPQAGVKGKADG